MHLIYQINNIAYMLTCHDKGRCWYQISLFGKAKLKCARNVPTAAKQCEFNISK